MVTQSTSSSHKSRHTKRLLDYRSGDVRRVGITQKHSMKTQSGTSPRHRRKKGRWEMEEHENFVRGLETHGRDWQTIAERFVPTRTPTQIRTHAQKYEKKLERAMSFSQKTERAQGMSTGRLQSEFAGQLALNPYADGRTHGNSVHNHKSQIRSESPEPSSMVQAVNNVVHPTPPCFSVNGPPSIEYPPPSSFDAASSNYHGGIYGGSTSTSSSIAQRAGAGAGGGASSNANPSHPYEQASYTEGVMDNSYGGFAQEEEITGDGAEIEAPESV